MANENAIPPEGQAGDLAQLMETLSAINKRLDGQSALIERMRKHNEPEKSQEQGKQPDGLLERIKALEAKDEALHVREQKLTRRQVCSAVATKLREKGIAAVQGDDVAEVIVSRSPDKFQVDDTGAVTIQEGDTTLSLDSWASIFLASDHGKAYLPAKANPRLGIPSQINAGKAGKMVALTRDDLASGNFDPTLTPENVVLKD